MKKVNSLLAILYVNTLFLVIIFSYFIGTFIQIAAEFIFKIKIEGNNLENQSNIFEHLSTVFIIWFVLYCIISIINIVSIIIDYRKNDTELLFKKMKRVKIGLIPYWVINFICYLPISVVMLLVGHGFGFLIVPIFIFASYMVLCLTSLFSILYLLNLKKNNNISKKQFIIHTLLQLIFVVDIIDTIYLIIKLKKCKCL
jgi:hypothetical protein